MRHERVLDKKGYSRVSVTAAWPAGSWSVHLQFAEVEEFQQAETPAAAPIASQAKLLRKLEAFAPTPAAPDVPAAVGAMLFAAYAALITAFAVATVGSAQSIFAITISALFVVIYFTVPRIFFGVEPKAGDRPNLDRFMHQGLQTLTGHCTGRDALVQMLIVPVLLTFAALAMGIAAAIFM